MIFDQVFRLSLPGKWRDAWMYMDALLAWDRNNQLHRFPVEELQALVGERAGKDIAPLFELALFRNEWKVSTQFKNIATSPAVKSTISSVLASSFMNQDAVMDFGLTFQQLPVESPDGIILDTEIYGNRVYIGSTKGTYETRYVPSRAGEPRYLEELSPWRTSAVNAKYSALNVSAGDNGLWFKQIVFGSGDEQVGHDSEESLRSVAEVPESESTAFASRNLLNYDRDRVPKLLRSRGRMAQPHSNAKHVAFQVEGYEQAERLDELADNAFAGQLSLMDSLFSEAPVEILGNAGPRLLVARGDSLRVLDLRWTKNRTGTTAQLNKKFSDGIRLPRDEVLSTHRLGGNFAVESYSEVNLVTPNGVRKIYDGEVATLRTFEGSVRYKEVLLLVTEDSIELVGTL